MEIGAAFMVNDKIAIKSILYCQASSRKRRRPEVHLGTVRAQEQ